MKPCSLMQVHVHMCTLTIIMTLLKVYIFYTLTGTHFCNLSLSLWLLDEVSLIEHHDHVTACDLADHQALYAPQMLLVTSINRTHVFDVHVPRQSGFGCPW